MLQRALFRLKLRHSADPGLLGLLASFSPIKETIKPPGHTPAPESMTAQLETALPVSGILHVKQRTYL